MFFRRRALKNLTRAQSKELNASFLKQIHFIGPKRVPWGFADSGFILKLESILCDSNNNKKRAFLLLLFLSKLKKI
jgi:hypothetical protein